MRLSGHAARAAAWFSFLFLALLSGESGGADARKSSERALEILREIDDMWRGESSHGILTMEVKTAHYTRTLRLETWSKGKENTLVRILYPLKEKGTATLKSGSSIYTYLPQTDRTIRLTSGMMMGSWMGSHFTNDDLVKESRLTEDYYVNIVFEGEKDGREIMEFDLTPKPDAPVVWGKITLVTRAEDHLPLEEIYYDEEMSVARTMTFSDIKEMGGRKIPARLKVVPADRPEEYTRLIYHEIEFDVGLDGSFFSLARLRRM